MKFHLKRVVGNSILTFEEFVTILCQVEACLNSRPLYPLTECPNDLTPLTPAHFLIGERLTNVLQPDLCDLKPGRLPSYQLLQQKLQHFWSRWAKEYI